MSRREGPGRAPASWRSAWRASRRLAARRARLRLAALAVVLSGCTSGPLIDPATDFVVYNARVWDGTGAPMTLRSLMQIGEGRILSVAPMPDETEFAALLDAGVASLDAMGWYVIPGLINVHGHVGGTWIANPDVDYGEYVARELARYARFGVTTVNSLGGEREPAFALRDESWEDGPIGRARLLAAGPVVTGLAPEVVTVNADAAAAMNPDWIKIRVDDNLGATTKMDSATYHAVIARAGHHGLRVASHIFYHEDAKALLRAGTGMIAHSIRDEPVDDETIALFHETGVCYVPTLAREVSTFVYGERPGFFDDPFFATDADSAQIMVVSDPTRQAAVRESGTFEAYGRALDIAQDNLATLMQAGVRVAFGTDSGPMGRFQGYFEHMEVDLMAAAGLTAEEILHSATSVAADCLGRDDVGTLEPGRRADFVVLRANPLANPASLRAIEGVWIGGVRVEGSRRG